MNALPGRNLQRLCSVILPREAGEGDHAKHGGRVMSHVFAKAGT
jgi:hypothetical protein